MRVEKRTQSAHDLWRVAQLALPDNQDTPTLATQAGAHTSIARRVAFEFLPPKRDARFRHSASVEAGVTVPKAAVDEDDAFPLGKNDVRVAGQRPSMQPEAVSE